MCRWVRAILWWVRRGGVVAYTMACGELAPLQHPTFPGQELIVAGNVPKGRSLRGWVGRARGGHLLIAITLSNEIGNFCAVDVDTNTNTWSVAPKSFLTTTPLVVLLLFVKLLLTMVRMWLKIKGAQTKRRVGVKRVEHGDVAVAVHR